MILLLGLQGLKNGFCKRHPAAPVEGYLWCSGSIRIQGKNFDRDIFPEGVRSIHHQRMLDRQKDRPGSQRRCNYINGIVKRQKVKTDEILQPEPDLAIRTRCRDTTYFEQFLCFTEFARQDGARLSDSSILDTIPGGNFQEKLNILQLILTKLHA